MLTFTILMIRLSSPSSILFPVSRKGWPLKLLLVMSTYQSKIYSTNTALLKTTLSKLNLRSPVKANRSWKTLVRFALVVTQFLLRRFAAHRKNKLCHLLSSTPRRIIRIRQSRMHISKNNRHNSIGLEKETKRWCINCSLPILLLKAAKWRTIRESGHFTQTISTMLKLTQMSSSCKEAWTLSTKILQCMTAMFHSALVAEDRPWEGLLIPQLNHPLRTIWSCRNMRPWKKSTCNKRPWICLTPECPMLLSNHHSDLRAPETLHQPKLTITSKRIS